jgi:hypothetical protein
MAYSFTDSDKVDAKPAMVPMADILNHVSDNNANLEFGEEFLSMVTTQTVAKVSGGFFLYSNFQVAGLPHLTSFGFQFSENFRRIVKCLIRTAIWTTVIFCVLMASSKNLPTLSMR